MKNTFFLFLISILVFSSCSTEEPWQPLFNGQDLTGWDTWCGPTEEGGVPVGLNKDPLNLFSVVDLEGEKVIKISGEINASIATQEEFENYHLVMEFKWGEKVYSTRNSGLLYHSYGDFGAGIGVWMSSHELQLKSGNIGDSYRMGKSYCEIPMKKNAEEKYIYSKGAEKAPSIPDTETRIIAKDADYENPVGEWNKIELYCLGRTSVHVINGKVNMINYNSGKYLGPNNIEPLSKGKIQLQSEGGELFIRSIKVQPISEIPQELLQ
ncbi:3-keto-disaccharide hydrolase [Maribellus maritimus]|uniref:3-keto-disaccharide hydrolase n=1 Tax=Maribellus maritimus TaxID=2870838 RepID=UPI001EEC03AE|nr:DUF1080 domain-containing protein [Maribellus maritimus]MCG6185927.1 DUF1080 domain-containing protein [Maribellus maritimus]